MEKRYQVFVSSTYEDLRNERQEVMQALLELDCMPAGMELFPAADESQWSLIKRVIDECDYYVVILGGRYGSCDPDGMGYTEKEYRYALEIGKPTIAFLHKDPAEILAGKTESTENGKVKLAAFRELLEKKLCKHWSSAAELGSVVSRSLVRLIKDSPAIGWVRADELPDKDAALELLKLRRRVDELESELARVRTSAPKGGENLAQGEDPQVLRYTFTSGDEDEDLVDHESRSAEFEATWNSIFAVVAPRMLNELSEFEMHRALSSFVESVNMERLRNDPELTGSQLQDFWLHDEDFQTIKVQLRALGLIAKSEKPRSVKDTETHWTLTPYGDEVMTRLRAIKRSDGQPEEPEEAEGE